MADHLPMEQFPANAREALQNGPQRQALRAATNVFDERRATALATTPDWQAWRETARAVKDHTLLHLDHYLEQFEANCTRAPRASAWRSNCSR